MNAQKKYDFLIIGGGIFGCYAALYLAGKGRKICLLEKEKELFKKASIVNQARLHSGYHYPRSIATAVMSDDYKERFIKEHAPFINSQFEKYYAIEKFGSLTDAAQFERFCHFIGIKFELVMEHPLFNFQRLEALYLTKEYTFDPILMGEYYKQQLEENPRIEIRRHTKILEAECDTHDWKVTHQNIENQEVATLKATTVINATYSGSNGVNRLFGVSEIELMHEISEITFFNSKELKNIGLTVMDGQFGSIMPYGKSNLLSLSSVAYTHHKVSFDRRPVFDCQKKNPECRPDFLSNCNCCPAKPSSNYRKMMSQIRHYFSKNVQLHYYSSFFTIKSKLKANHIDDGRPTEVNLLHENPHFYCIFAGKINSIYEVEKVG